MKRVSVKSILLNVVGKTGTQNSAPHNKKQKKHKGKRELKFKNLFIVTYGRSGSTLLQGILNDIDGVLVRGENNNFIYHLFESYRALKLAKEERKGQKPQKAWYGAYLLDDEYFITESRQLIKRLLLADYANNPRISCFGFKEIRYINVIDDLQSYLDFLKKVFPEAAFIFNFRNSDDVTNSGWWKTKDKKELKERLRKFELNCREYLKEHQENCFYINYEDVVEKSQKLADLFAFIGAKYDEDKIDHILSLPHSYDPVQKYVKDIFDQ